MKTRLSTIFTLILLFASAIPANAANETIEKTYCTQGIAYDSIDDLKLNLLNNAKTAVINELFGEFIVASTAVENFVVTKDQIQTSSIGFVRVEGNTDFHNGEDFADVCVTIRAYITDEDKAKFEPEKIGKKYCDSDENLTTAQLISYVKDEAIIQALVEYNPKLKGAERESLLPLVQKVAYRGAGNGFISDTQTYCATFEGYVIPVEIDAFLTQAHEAPPITNVAIGKVATQSSDYQGLIASKAVDGNADGGNSANSFTHTNQDLNAWWQVDLGEVYDIDRIQLWNRTGCCTERLADIYVFVSKTDINGRSFNSLVNDPNIWQYQIKGQAGTSQNLSVSEQGRFVRVQLAGTNYLSLAEVEVYGSIKNRKIGGSVTDTTESTVNPVTEFKSGIYKAESFYLGVKYESTYTLEISGNEITGSAEACSPCWTGPVWGTIDGDKVVLHTGDCPKQGQLSAYCSHATGTIKGNVITGEFTDTNSAHGTWTLYLQGAE